MSSDDLDRAIGAYHQSISMLSDAVSHYNELAAAKRTPAVRDERMDLERAIEELIYAASASKECAPVYGCLECGTHRRGFQAHFSSIKGTVFVDYVEPIADHVCAGGVKVAPGGRWDAPALERFEQRVPRILWS